MGYIGKGERGKGKGKGRGRMRAWGCGLEAWEERREGVWMDGWMDGGLKGVFEVR